MTWEIVEDMSVNKLILLFLNKLATAVLKVNKQSFCALLNIDFSTQELIEVLSLQVITCSAVRLAADDLDSLSMKLSDNKLNSG